MYRGSSSISKASFPRVLLEIVITGTSRDSLKLAGISYDSFTRRNDFGRNCRFLLLSLATRRSAEIVPASVSECQQRTRQRTWKRRLSK